MKKPRKKHVSKSAASAIAPSGGENFIRAWRDFNGLNQAELAELIGMSVPTVSNYETKKGGYVVKTLEKFAKALKCTVTDLLTRDPVATEELWNLWGRATPSQRQQIIGMVRGFLGSGQIDDGPR